LDIEALSYQRLCTL
jgi:hypothetical protein